MLKSFGTYVGKAAPTAIALVLVAGFAHATVPDGSSMIHGCYTNKGGAVKVINTDVGQHCSTKQTPISWSGSNIVARTAWAGSEAFPQPGDFLNLDETLSPSWTQGASEIDEIRPGTITVTIEPGCQVTTWSVKLFVTGYAPSTLVSPGAYTAQYSLPTTQSPAFTTTLTVPLAPYSTSLPESLTLFEPGTPTSRNVEAVFRGEAVGSSCASNGVHLVGMTFDVEAVR